MPFIGLRPYVNRASEARGIEARFVGQSAASWHSRQLQDVFGQLDTICRTPHVSETTKGDMVRHAAQVIGSIAALRDGAIQALEDLAQEHGLDLSPLNGIVHAKSTRSSAPRPRRRPAAEPNLASDGSVSGWELPPSAVADVFGTLHGPPADLAGPDPVE